MTRPRLDEPPRQTLRASATRRRGRGTSFGCAVGMLLAAFTSAATGCAFSAPPAPVPSYACSSAGHCESATCIEGVCASPTGSGYSLVLRTSVLPASSASAVRAFTHEPFAMLTSETRDLAFPEPHAAYGVVRYASSALPLPGTVTFSRDLAVAGTFIDNVRGVTPTAAVAPDGGDADYLVEVPSNDAYLAVFTPPTSITPPLAGIPGNLVGKPLDEVFPPFVQPFDPADVGTVDSSRLDFTYPASLFTSCAGETALACTAAGRIVSKTPAGDIVPEAGLRVFLESVGSEQPISTAATTDANGQFAIRISSTAGAHRLRISGSTVRPAYPSIALVENAFDPYAAVDVVLDPVRVVHFVGHVEYGNLPVPYAVVRAVSRRVRSASGTDIIGASFESVVRTMTATNDAGFFAFDLVEGEYDFIVSDPATPTRIAQASAFVALPAIDGVQRGQTFVLQDLLHVGGTVSGPDEQTLRGATVEAIPYVGAGLAASPEAFARSSAATTDAAGHFDLAADPGFYDLVVSNPLATGLPAAVLPGTRLQLQSVPLWLPIVIPRAAVLSGHITSHDGVPIPDARVEAYVWLEADPFNPDERTIALGQAIADANGYYRLLVPSRLSP